MKLANGGNSKNRFAFIETRLLWENGLKARDLAEAFSLSRQASQSVIDAYRRLYPAQMTYNRTSKRHEPTEAFKPAFIRADALCFLDYLRGQSLCGHYREEADWSEIEVTDVDRLLRPKLSLGIIRTIIYALQNEQVVTIDYRKRSLNPPSMSVRLISPNHLVFADDRYHVRAFCHLKKRFLDFVLSRIAHAEPISAAEEQWVSSREDKDWNEIIKMRFEPNPELPDFVRQAIIMNYDIRETGVLIISCKHALSHYIRRKLLATHSDYGMPLWIEHV